MRLNLLLLVCASVVFAQHGARGVTGTQGTGGNIAHPGVPGSTLPATPGTSSVGTLVGPGPGFGQVGATHGRPGRVGNPGRRSNGFGYGTGVVPYYGGFATGPVYSPEPGTYDPIFGVYAPEPGAYGNNGPQQGMPTVVINQNFAPDTVRPVIRDYSNAFLPAPGPQGAAPTEPTQQQTAQANDANTPMILIAMKDHTIYPALAYWIQGDTLNYVMMGGAVNHVSVSEVDRELSMKLNAERRPDFRLP